MDANEGPVNERTLSPGGARAPADAVDPELASLPEPPRTERKATLLLLGATALASLAMVVLLARDAAYAFASPDVTDLGDLRVAAPAALVPNEYVRGIGMIGGAGALRFERSFESDTFRLAPIAGRPDVWVELRVPSGSESDRYIPPTSFAGRLVSFDAAGSRNRGLAAAVSTLTGERVPAHAFLLIDGETPAQARWAVALVGLFAIFAVWNTLAVARIVRKVS